MPMSGMEPLSLFCPKKLRGTRPRERLADELQQRYLGAHVRVLEKVKL
jgi:hypothetical protein